MTKLNACDRERLILIFLWKWKLATTAALTLKFFENIAPHSAYKALHRLKEKGLITVTNDPYARQFFWTLTKKGFATVMPELPALAQIGHRSEHVVHDHLVMSFHLGEWLCGMPDGALTFSEQQLRRYQVGDYPTWVPKDQLHRADGYSKIGGGTFAFEVELSRKNDSDYYRIGQFYDGEPLVTAIFWLVPNRERAIALLQCFNKAQCPLVSRHHFILLPDFVKSGWNATLQHGSLEGKTLVSLLGKNVGNSWETFPTKRLLDARKCLDKSRYSFDAASAAQCH